MDTKVKPCRHCGIPVEVPDVSEFLFGILHRELSTQVSCDKCIAISKKAAKEAQCMAILRDMMPKSAMTPDDGRLMQARAFSEAFPKSMNGKLNLVLNGPCRTGKTYLAWQLMKSALMNGKSIGSLSGAMIDVTQLAQLTLPDVVLFDEFSKVDFMDKAAMRFVFNLVNARTEDKKVTIFISNITPAELESVATMASPMMAPSIFARINESKIARVIS